MPNHETNNVVIVGDPEKVRAFVSEGLRELSADENRGKTEQPERVIDFTLIVPEPENIERGSCSGEHAPGVVCWLNWNPANWGTKWNAYGHTHFEVKTLRKVGTQDVYGRVDLRFETAWSQPTPIFEAIQERWGLTVHAVTQDEGGYPDVVFGDPVQSELLERVVTYDFTAWDTTVSEDPS